MEGGGGGNIYAKRHVNAETIGDSVRVVLNT
jgi:hypothetical protein